MIFGGRRNEFVRVFDDGQCPHCPVRAIKEPTTITSRAGPAKPAIFSTFSSPKCVPWTTLDLLGPGGIHTLTICPSTWTMKKNYYRPIGFRLSLFLFSYFQPRKTANWTEYPIGLARLARLSLF